MIGIDLIEIGRIEETIAEHGARFLQRVFTERERSDCQNNARLAGRFAAKEAVAKALGCGIGEQLSWQDIEIRNNEQGMPYVVLSDQAREAFGNIEIAVSISHCRTYATAIAMRKS